MSIRSMTLLFSLLFCMQTGLYATEPVDEITTQSRQISVFMGWMDSGFSYDQTYSELQQISLRNFSVIGDTVFSRFGSDSEKARQFGGVYSSAKQAFEDNQITPQQLTLFYRMFVELLDSQPRFGMYNKRIVDEIGEVSKTLTPIPVVSKTGSGKLSTLCNLLAQGCCYVGVPLDQSVEFDGERSGPMRFFEHDLFHASYIGSQEDVAQTIPLLKRFNEVLFRDKQDKSIKRLIQFLAIHEKGGNTLMSLAASQTKNGDDAGLDFSKWCCDLLKIAIVNPKDHRFYSLYGEWADYAVEKGIMEEPSKQKTLGVDPEIAELERQKQKTLRFAGILNAKIDELIAQFSNGQIVISQ